MFRIHLLFLFAFVLLLAGCGYGHNYNMGGGNAPAIKSLAPNMGTAGDPAFTLTVTGSGLGTDSVVYWNGTALPTSYSNGTTVTAQVPAADIANTGMVPVYVHSGGQNSNNLTFTVQ